MVPTLGASPPHPNFGAVRSVAPATHPSPPQPSIHRQALSLSHSGPPAKMAVSASAIALCCLLVSPAALRITTVTLPPSFFFFVPFPPPSREREPWNGRWWFQTGAGRVLDPGKPGPGRSWVGVLALSCWVLAWTRGVLVCFGLRRGE